MIFQTLLYYFMNFGFFLFSIILHFIIKLSDWCHTSYIEKDKYDYIIVGGGTAGSILAARLSENPDVSVLLIEAGIEKLDFMDMPVLGPLKQLSELDWQYATIPQKHSCFGLDKNISKWASGKILGGSTHLNFMLHVEGHKNDYRIWEDASSSHWNLEDINYYFAKAKKCHQSFRDFCNNRDGSVSVRTSVYSTELSETFLQAARELGYEVGERNIKSKAGFMKPHITVNSYGKRWTSDQILSSVRKKRKNLKILTNVVTEKILLLRGFEAYGVKVRKNGIEQTIYAKTEIIVSAGAVGSPKLLMLSGIGSESVLQEAKVPIKIKLPVGQNLQDHITTGLDLGILKNPIFSYLDLINPVSIYQYFIHGEGPYTSSLVDALGLIHSALVNPENDSPDLEFMAVIIGISTDKGVFMRKTMGISEKVWNDYFALLTSESVISILPVLLHPKSVGEIKLDPNNPKGNPKINPNYLSHKTDVNTLVEGIRIVQRLLKTRAFRNLGVTFNDKIFPGCGFLEFNSDEYWRCYVRHLTLSIYHPAGTCKMGKLENDGVVDHRLRVHKSNKLRVIDASIMPTLPSANTNAAVIMIAEKGADLIKEDFFSRLSCCLLNEIFITPNICY